jgi:hypothetical protein
MLYEIDNGLFVRYIDDKRKLDDRKLETLQKAKVKLDILASSNASYHTVISKILTHLDTAEKHSDEENALEILQPLFNINKNQIVDPNSLYERKRTEREVVMDPVVEMPVEIIDDAPVINTSTITVSDANDCALKLLNNQDEITIDDLPNDESLIPDLMLLTFFADNLEAQYGLELSGNKVVKCGYTMDEFTIRRKKYV